MVAVDPGLLMFGGVGGSGVPFAQECWLLQLGPNPLLGLKDNEVCCLLFKCLHHTVTDSAPCVAGSEPTVVGLGDHALSCTPYRCPRCSRTSHVRTWVLQL